LPEIVARAGKAAVFAADEFFFGRIRNEHTRKAYFIAVKRFLTAMEKRGVELVAITPRDVGQYLDQLKKENTSVATRKQHLAALRHFFDGMVNRHAIILNPALSVRGERYEVVEGKTPEITVKGARALLASINLKTAVEPAPRREEAGSIGFPTAAHFTLRVRTRFFPIACRHRSWI
jgi:site-specific recombinase XerD